MPPSERPSRASDWSEVANVSSLIVENAPSGFFVYAYHAPDQLILEQANPAAVQITGIGFEEAKGKAFEQVWPAAASGSIKEALLNVVRTGETFEREGPYTRDDLSGVYWIRAFRLDQNYLAIAFEDITELRNKEIALRESEERFRMLADAASEGITVLDQGRVVEINRAGSEMFGYTHDEVIGMQASEFIAPESRYLVEHHISTQFAHAYRAWGLRKNGEKFPLRISGRPFHYRGKDLRLTAIRDMSDAVMVESLRRLATTDELTGLRNHRLFQEALHHEVERSRRSGSELSLLLADVDHFKRVNDTFGHLTGDHVLRHIAKQLLRGRRVNDVVARYGGEEFAILLPDTGSVQADELAERVRLEVEENPTHEAETIVPATISIGVASCPEHADTPTGLFDAADRALYQAKRDGRNRTQVFQADVTGRPSSH